MVEWNGAWTSAAGASRLFYMQTSETIDALLGCGPLKAWSVIVTLLGDLCLTRADRVGGRMMQDIVGQMGITDQAMRVALHRLRKDGWVESRKRGRDAAYALSDQGWQETQAVRERIYASAGPSPREVFLAIGAADMSAAGFMAALPGQAVPIAPRTALMDLAPAQETGLWAVPVPDRAVPGWVTAQLSDEALCADYIRLTDAAKQVLAAPLPDDPVRATALRLLTLHHWRRLRLRHGDLPDLLLGPDWAGARARVAVMAVLDRVERIDL